MYLDYRARHTITNECDALLTGLKVSANYLFYLDSRDFGCSFHSARTI